VVEWLVCLPLDPRVAGWNLADAIDFLRAIRIRSIPSFGWEVKPEAPCRKILRHVKITCNWERNAYKAKFSLHSSIPCTCSHMTAGRIARGALVDESGVFTCRYHLALFLHAYISAGGRAVGSLVAAVQKISLTPSDMINQIIVQVRKPCWYLNRLRLIKVFHVFVYEYWYNTLKLITTMYFQILTYLPRMISFEFKILLPQSFGHRCNS
jgi:hypothetical protein